MPATPKAGCEPQKFIREFRTDGEEHGCEVGQVLTANALEGVKFVDVRTAKGFATGHVPGAYNLDVSSELSRESLSRIVRKDEEVVLSCHGKTCPDSAYASAKAVLWGFKRVYYFSPGFPGWEEAGYPVEKSELAAK